MRIIPIDRLYLEPNHASSCSEGDGEIPKQNLPLARREFLKGSGLLMGVLAAGSTLAALAPSPVWALELKTLSTQDGQALMAMGRTLYPHKKLPDAVYALLAKDLDAKASADPKVATTLKDGIASLNNSAGGHFDSASAATRLKVVKSMEGQPFFALVRGTCVTSLYDNDMAFAVLGYPGASWDKGGYITRGFQDLKWLPAPSAEASPPSWIAQMKKA
ncbi:hypothetical protein BH10PSE17_BH10PSE17_28740 [soil metagenome]